MNDELPPANLILQALHAIRAEGQKTNERLDALTTKVDGTNARLDETNVRLATLREFTVGALTELNRKTDRNTGSIDHLTEEVREMNSRFDHFLTGEGSKIVHRVNSLEEEVRRLAAKVDH